jgi:hypothetical protein
MLVARQETPWLVSPSAVPALLSPPSRQSIRETRMFAVVELRQLPAYMPTSPALTKRGELDADVGPGSGTDNHAIDIGLRMSW